MEHDPTSQENPPSPDWSAQLTQLNERARWYATQGWQLPLGYLLSTAIPLGQVENLRGVPLACVLFVAMGIGLLLLVHLLGVHRRMRTVITELQLVEARMFGRASAQYAALAQIPILTMMVLIVLGYAAAGTYVFLTAGSAPVTQNRPLATDY